jgi:putative ABC transport system permease protein
MVRAGGKGGGPARRSALRRVLRASSAQRLRRTLTLLRPLVDDGFAQLAAEWRRHLLTLVGVVWGSAAVVFLLSTGAGFYNFLDVGFKKTGDRHTMIHGEHITAATGGGRPGRKIALTRADVDRLRAGVPSARVIAAEVLRGTVAVRTTRRTRSTVVSAATPDLASIQELHVARGRFFDRDDDRRGRAVAVIGSNLVPIFFGAANAIGRTLHIEGKPFQVIGVLAHKGQQLMVNWGLHDDMVFIPLRAGRPVFGQGDEVEYVYAKPRRLDDIPAMHAEIRAVLAPWHHIPRGDTDAVLLQSVTEYTESFRAIGVGLQILLGCIGTIALAMAGVGVANLMIAIVNDRRMELAVRRACGARRRDVTFQLLVETLLIVLAGGAVGVLLGAGLALGIGLLPLPEAIPAPRISTSVLLATFGVLAGVGIGAGIVPARLASRVDPGAAMRVT